MAERMNYLLLAEMENSGRVWKVRCLEVTGYTKIQYGCERKGKVRSIPFPWASKLVG